MTKPMEGRTAFLWGGVLDLASALFLWVSQEEKDRGALLVTATTAGQESNTVLF